ncbi:MAG: hypothetical protein ACRDQZ_12245, partial [Mycobacteriales bacterium]
QLALLDASVRDSCGEARSLEFPVPYARLRMRRRLSPHLQASARGNGIAAASIDVGCGPWY